MTDRLSQINTWVSGLVPQLQEIKEIQADASSRKYYRAHTKTDSFIVMDTVPGEELLNFIQIAELLRSRITVPDIIQRDLNNGLLLLSDFGGETYLKALENASESRVNFLYENALLTLQQMQTIKANLLPMGPEYIANRMEVFSTWYLQRHLNTSIKQNLLQNLINLCADCFAKQPQVLVHVDYHSRNLMVLNNDQPGVLDFQDAMLGPITYDLVSLFQDAYIVWPRAKVENWIQDFAKIAQIPFGPHLLRDFDLVGLQRHLKNLGVFARLHYHYGKSHYLPHIPTLLNYINSTCARYPELAELNEFLQTISVTA